MYVRLRTWLWCCTLVATLPAAEASMANRSAAVVVVTDGRFEEWQEVSPLAEGRSASDPAADYGLGEVRVLDDPSYLHLSVGLARPVNVQSFRGTLKILLDRDDNPSTGGPVRGMAGVDLVLELSRRDRPRPAGYGAGNGVRWWRQGGLGDVESGYSIGLLTAPTWSTDRTEVRLARRGMPGEESTDLLAAKALRFKVVLESSDGTTDETRVARYALAAPGSETDSEPASEPGARQPQNLSAPVGTFRVVQLNVAEHRFERRQEPTSRLLAALEPDVILLDEVYGTVTREELGRFFELPALARLGEWRFVLGRSGGRQKAVIATRQLIRPEAGLIAVHYRPGTLEALAERFPTPPVEQLLAAEHQRGLATAGAWVTLGQREVLFVPLDLQAAGYDGSAEDVLRELQAARLVEAISAVLGEEAPLIVGGDLNLVGARTPLDILRDGLGLEAVEAYRLTDRSQATWRSSGGGAFTPGRLDFVLPSVAHFEVSSSFIFDTAELADEQLRELGLTRTDSAEASNHLLTVADLRPR